MRLEKLRDDVRRHGVAASLAHGAYAVAERAVGFKALRGMTLGIDDIDPKYLGELPPFTCHRAPALEFAQLPGAAGLAPDAFYRGAALRGDWCYYVSDGDTIASYGWYSTGMVPVVDDTSIRFSPTFVYMYKGFTLPAYRGHQLHAYGMAHAAACAVADGYRGLISYVEVHNEGSLRSVARLGYRSFGTCFRARILGRTLTFSSPGCKPYSFQLVVPVDPDAELRNASSRSSRRSFRGESESAPGSSFRNSS